MKNLKALILSALLCAPAVFAASCLENRDFYQSLPTVIGREEQTGKYPFALNCDTVFVRKGVTTVVYPGTILYFARPSINSVIKVEGTLILKGTKNSYVTLGGSLDSTKNGVEAGKKSWGGIEVAEGGKLEMEFAGFMRAPTPVTAFSFQVKILNSWFKGSSGIILPDGSLYPMESSWHAINNMDLTKGNSDRKAPEADRPKDAISAKEKADLFKKSSSSGWNWKATAGGVAALAMIGVGAAWLLQPEEAAAKQPVVDKPKPKDSPIEQIGPPGLTP